MDGKFITFEGGEGTGKSTQIRLLADRLRKLDISVTVTREPGGSKRAETIRGVLLSGRAKKLGPMGEAVMFAAARIDHVRETIRPALARGAWVLCDRFADSTRVYQGLVGDLSPETIGALERVALAGLVPDLTIIIDTPAEIGLARAAARGEKDRFEREGIDVHNRIRDGFLAVAASEPSRCVVVDGAGEIAKVAELIWAIVARRFGLADEGKHAATVTSA